MASGTNNSRPSNGRHSSRHVARRHRRRERAPQSNFGRSILIVALLTPFLLGVLVLGAVTLGLNAAVAIGRDAPRLADQKQIVLAQTSRIYAADGSLLSYLYGTENRTIVSGERIPRVMKDAIVAIEDERFYQHKGVDLQGIVRALVVDLKAGKLAEGASTITQQLVGGLYLDRTDTSFTRKFREAMLAWQLESQISKDEILDLYLNTIYFGSNAYGVEAAARTYFDKEPSELTLPEAALLAGLPQAPSDYSPRINMAKARIRRQEVLKAMYVNGFIDASQYETSIATTIDLAKSSPYVKVQEPYVVAYTRQQLINMFGQDAVYKGGLNVQTSINPAYQRIAEEAIASSLDRKGDPSAALVAVDPRTGLIRAMVGGTDYDKTKFNLAAQGRRQPGSAFKTFALVAAVEKGVDPQDTYYTSAPVSISLPGATETWDVTTYGGNYAGPINLVDATLHSDNSVYAQLAVDVGAKSIVDVASRMGITSKINENPAIVLGGLTYGVSPFEMASAYGTLANQGRYVPPSVIIKVTDAARQGALRAQPKGQAGRLGGRRVRRDPHPRAERAVRHRHPRPARSPGRRQDRHDRRLERCLVLRLRPPTLDGGLGGAPRGPGLDDQRARHPRRWGHLPRRDLAQVHEPRLGRLQGPGLRPPQGTDGLQPGAEYQAALRRHRLPGHHDVEPRHLDHPARNAHQHQPGHEWNDLARHHAAAHDLSALHGSPHDA